MVGGCKKPRQGKHTKNTRKTQEAALLFRHLMQRDLSMLSRAGSTRLQKLLMRHDG